jgi:hypothetical protein
MMRRWLTVLLVAMVASSSWAASTDFTKPKSKGRLAGKLRETTYIAPKGIFSLPSPVDGDWGGIVEDKPGYVAFSDDAGQLYRIEYINYVADFDAVRAELGDRKFFERMISASYLPNTILAAFPDTKFVAQSYVESPEPVLVTCWFVPKGSNIVQYQNGVSARLDTYRAVAVLVRKPWLYFISLAPSTGKISRLGGDPENQLWPLMEKAVNDFIRTIEFKAP